MMTSSYNKRKQEVEYHQQCCAELEIICKSLCDQLNEHGIEPKFPLLSIAPDQFITHVNSRLQF